MDEYDLKEIEKIFKKVLDERGITVEALTIVKTKRAARIELLILPDWMPMPQWEAWLETRKKNRKPLTDFAKKLAIGKLEQFKDAGLSPAVILAQSAFNGWTGLFAPKE